MAEKLIELRDIKKSYGSVYALGGVSLSVHESEVVGLIGDNGAGKSTLIKILSGVVRPTSGEILVRGKPVTGWSAARSREAGIETVFQDRALCVQQSIVRNIFMGREIAGPLGFIDVDREIAEAGRLMREIGFTSKVFSPHSIVGQLSGGERQGVAIARAIYKQADLIVLDEPTTALSLTETAKVFHFVRQVRDERAVDPLHRPQHPPRLRHRRPLRGARPRPRGARGAQGPLRLGGGADQLHGAAGASRRAARAEGDGAMSETGAAKAADYSHPHDRGLRRFVSNNRAPLGSFAVFVVMLLVFLIANPTVFSSWTLYSSVLTTLPVAIFMTVPLVFVVTAGEIDLSFPATMGLAAWAFALVVQAGFDPFLGIVAAIVTGLVMGWLVGVLVVYANLSSLIATLGMNFVIRGVILIFTEGKSIALVTLGQTWAYKLFASMVFGIPIQILWAIAFVIFSIFLYKRHRFGVQVHAVGDNPDSAQQMGINVKRVRVMTFVFVGFGAACAGVFSTMINYHLVADLGRRLPVAGAGLGVRRRHADLGRDRHGVRRGDRGADGVVHPDRASSARG